MSSKNFAIYIFVALISLAVGAHYGKQSNTPKTDVAQPSLESAYERVTKTGVLRCGYGISPPRVIKDPNTGVISGFDVDVWNEIGAALALKVEWVEEAGWGNFIEALNSHRFDAFCSAMFPDPGRSKFLSLTMPTMYSLMHGFVRADDKRFDGDIEKINRPEIKLPVIDGDVSASVSKSRFPKASLLTLPQTNTVSDMILSVTTGKADAVFLDMAMFEAYDRNNQGVLRKIENVPPAFTFPLYYGFSSSELQLRDMVNVAIRSLIDSGKMEQLASAHISDYLLAVRNYKESN